MPISIPLRSAFPGQNVALIICFWLPGTLAGSSDLSKPKYKSKQVLSAPSRGHSKRRDKQNRTGLKGLGAGDRESGNQGPGTWDQSPDPGPIFPCFVGFFYSSLALPSLQREMQMGMSGKMRCEKNCYHIYRILYKELSKSEKKKVQ